MADDWRASTWGEEISLEYGKGLRGYDEAVGRYRVFGTNGPIGWTSEFLSPGPGVILGRKGAYRGVRYSREPFFVIDTAYYVVPKTELDMRWLFYAIKHHRLGEIDDGSPIPSTTRAAVYVRDVEVPPLHEQRAIGKLLGTLDDKIELNRRTTETLEAIARALFQSWFVDFDPVRRKAERRNPHLPRDLADLFSESFTGSEAGEIPEAWQISTVGDEFHLTMGQSPPGDTYNSDGVGVPLFQGRTDFGFRFPKRRIYCSGSARMARAGDTLVSVRAPVGDVNIAVEKCAVGRGVAAIRHNSGSVSYTYYSMQAQRDIFDRFEAEGTVFGSINKQDFASLPVVTPPPEVVAAFESLVSPLDERIALAERDSRTLSELRDVLLPKVISGQLRISLSSERLEDT